MRNFKLTVDRCTLHDSMIVIRFKGSLDADRVSSIGQTVNGVIEAGDSFVIAEMSEVTFISSPAFGELMGCKKRLVEKGGNLYLVGLDTENRAKLRMLGAEKIFEFLPTVSAAVRRYHWDNEDTGDSFRIQLPTVLSYVPEIRTFFSNIVRQKGYSKRDAFRIEAIIDELGNNAIEHGDPNIKDPVEIIGKIYRYKIELLVINRNSSATLASDSVREIMNRLNGETSFNLNEKRGRGVELVKMLCDEITAVADEDKTIIRIIKKKEV
ncbi:MAG: ATP-binding protein [Fibrobacteres bacterium]|nr:ATP-binding protein [Fibrobacterota bacterium]